MVSWQAAFMPRSTAIKVFWATILTGMVALLVTMLTDDRRLAFSPGVQALQVAANMAPGQRACQRNFVSEPAFDANWPDSRKIADTMRRSITEDLLAQYGARLQTDLGATINMDAVRRSVSGSSADQN